MKKQYILFALLLCCLLIESKANKVYFNNLSVKDGLSQVNIYSIYQDETGSLWFGSLEGINRYNGNSFKVFHPSQSNNGLTQNEIMAICGDKKGNIYIQALHDLIRYDIKKQSFHLIIPNRVFNIDYHKDTLWVVTDKGLQYRTDQDSTLQTYTAFQKENNAYRPMCITDQTIYLGSNEGISQIKRSDPKKHNNLLSGVSIKCLYQDKKENIWIGTSNKGVYKLSPDGDIENFTHQTDNPNSLSNNQVRCIVEDNFDNLWIGTFYGLNRYIPSKNKWERFIHENHAPHSLTHSSIFALYKDMQGGIWIGTYYGGINYFNPTSDFSNFYEANPDDSSALNFPFVGRMEEDNKHNLWICTEGGGLNYFDRETRHFNNYSTQKGQAPHNGQNNMKSIWYQKENGKLYIGTHNDGLVVFDTQSHQSHTLRNIPDKNNSLPNNVVNTIQYYKEKLVISTQSGIVAMNLMDETFGPLSSDAAISSILDKHTYETFYIDSNDNLWVASGMGGVSKANLNTGSIKHFHHKSRSTNNIGKFKVIHIFENHKGELFFSTVGSGLFKYLPETDNFESFSKEDNMLYSNYCYYVTETKTHELVVLHNRGISYLDTDKKKLLYIHRIPEISFCQGSSIYCTEDGELYLGGIGGMLSLSAKNPLAMDEKEQDFYFDQLSINNKSIYPGDGTRILSQILPYTNKIELNHDKNNLSIELGSSNFMRNRYKYEYQLKGFDKTWLPLYSSQIIYTNLAPGDYELIVRKISNAQTIYGQKSLRIIIHPPFYANIYAYLIYLLIICTVLFIIIRFNNRQAKLKASLVFERKEKEKIEELNQSKMRFFTNISHEFRTPLTLIMGQLEPLLQLSQLPPTIYNRMLRIYKNAEHMSKLISELLDIHKQEQGHLKLKTEHRDILAFTKEVYMLFYEYALKKHITYTFESPETSVNSWFDPQQMQKVIQNLLSNAFKYTKEGGSISVIVRTDLQYIRIQVKDTGTGIPQESIHKIFERFYQLDGQSSQFSLGTGIGLALVKSIVELHKGTIEVESKLNEGSCFTVILPIGNSLFEPEGTQTDISSPIVPDLNILPLQDEIPLPQIETTSANKPIILLVEDNEDILRMLVDIFTPIYEVHTARNGREGLEETQRLQPDIVLSDVMMPEMSGKKMCYKIKNCVDTSHIPVILLTALSSLEYTIEGYMYGADDYITKPFNVKLLVSRCNNLINNRKLIMEKFRSRQENVAVGNAINQADKDLLDKATAIIKENFENQSFNMNTLASKLGLGRNKLYTRIKDLTGLTPNELTLKLKLDESTRLLDYHEELNISEISDRLGFSSTPYFSKCFKSVFGMSPLSYRKRNEA